MPPRGRSKRRTVAATPPRNTSSRVRGRPTRYTPTRNGSSTPVPKLNSSRSASRKPRTNKKKVEWNSDEEEAKEQILDTSSEKDSDSDDEEVLAETLVESSESEVEDEESSSVSNGPRTRFLPWLQLPLEQIPDFPLPESSNDLLYDPELLLPSLEIYEICYNFYRIIQLSPFLFEDFCCALRSPDHSRLLAEIHISFIRLFFRDDEDNQTTFSVQDTNSAFNITVQLLDGMTYAEILRQYVESDKQFDQSILPILKDNYPFVDTKKRIIVLKWLCDRFLETAVFRHVIKNDGKLSFDEVCRECAKGGDLILCDGCEACFHTKCTELDKVPEGSWICSVCKSHDASGATTLKALGEGAAKQPIRLVELGRDRLGRRYWFVARRIFVDTNDSELYYYSSLPQLYNLVTKVDEVYFERELCNNISSNLNLIAQQMRATLVLTNKYRDDIANNLIGKKDIPLSYLEGENSFLMCDVMADILERTNNKKQASSDSLLNKIQKALGFSGSKLVDTFWSGGLSDQELIQRHETLLAEEELPEEEAELTNRRVSNMRGYRYSFTDGHYREYVNQYSDNELAKSAKQRGKERDRKRYMNLKFALQEEGEFTWVCPKGKDIYMSQHYTGRNIQQTLLKFMESVPDELYHRLWKTEKEAFMDKMEANYLQATKDPEQAKTMFDSLKYFILRIECALRKPVFSPIWWNSLGLTKLVRLTSELREKRQKIDQKAKKEEKALLSADPNDASDDIKFVKYRGKPSLLWKMKDEAFRLNSRGGMGGWLWVSSTFQRRNIKAEPLNLVDEKTPLYKKKASRLQTLIDHLAVKEELKTEDDKSDKNTVKVKCYSALCRFNNNSSWSCYNPNCPKTNETTVPRVSIPKKRTGTLGVDIAFPIPEPHQFKSQKTGRRSLLILPQNRLRILARQGGLKAATLPYGFHKTQKSNSLVWDYPCQRPLFDHCWRYSTQCAYTLHALALNLRIMYSCVRWADMEPSDDQKETQKVFTHYADHDEVRHVIMHKEYPPDGYYERYLTKVHFLALEEDMAYDNDDSETYRSGGGMKKTKKKLRKSIPTHASLQARKRGETERWMDGVDLKLFEIRAYWRRRMQAASTKPQLNNTTQAQRIQAAVGSVKRENGFASSSTLRPLPPRPIVQKAPISAHIQVLKTAFAAPAPAQNRTPPQFINQRLQYATTPHPQTFQRITVDPSQPSSSTHYIRFPASSQPRIIIQNTPSSGPESVPIIRRVIEEPRIPSTTRLQPNSGMYVSQVKRVYPRGPAVANGYVDERGKENGKLPVDPDSEGRPPTKRLRLIHPHHARGP